MGGVEYIRVGPQQSGDGGFLAGRGSKDGSFVSVDGHARYQEAVLRGNCYHASMQAGASLGTALTATAVTLTVYNPANSSVNLVMLECTLGITTGLAAAGTAVYVHAINAVTTSAAPSSNTSATIRNCLVGAGTGQAEAYTASTLPAAPVIMRTMASSRVIGATPVSEFTASLVDNIDGKIILRPNTAVTLQGIGTATSGIVSYMWEEVPIAQS